MRGSLFALSLASAALSLLAGCTAGPDYRPPATGVSVSPAATGGFVSGQGKGFVQADLPDRWWKLYDDPRLDALVEQVLAANTDLRAAGANIDNAEAVLRQTDAGRKLETSVNAAGTLLHAEHDEEPFPGKVHHGLSLSATYALDLAGKIRRGLEADLADREAAVAARDAVKVSIVAATVRAYAQVCAANYALGVNRRVVAIQNETVAATVRLARGGRGTAFDVSRARAQAQASAAALPGFAAQRQAALYMLATLMGKAPADYPKEVEGCAQLPHLARGLPVGDGAALIRRRPDVRAAERAIAGDTARIGVAMADLYPQVELFGGIGRLNVVGGTIGQTAKAYSLGPMISWSFPQRHAVEARIDAAEAKVRGDVARFDGTVLQALREAETAMERYARDRDQAAALVQARDSAALAAGQAGRLFRFGRSDFLSLLSAQASQAQAEVAAADARVRLVGDQVALFEALGGGWQ